MNWLDIVLLVILAGFMYGGFTRGLIVSILGFAGFSLGLKLAGENYLWAASKLGFIPSAIAAKIAGFILIWAAAMFLAAIIGRILKKAISLVGLGLVDRLGGVVFGLALGVFFCVLVLVLILNYVPADVSGFVQESKIASFMVNRMGFFFSLLPGDWSRPPQLPTSIPGIRT